MSLEPDVLEFLTNPPRPHRGVVHGTGRPEWDGAVFTTTHCNILRIRWVDDGDADIIWEQDVYRHGDDWRRLPDGTLAEVWTPADEPPRLYQDPEDDAFAAGFDRSSSGEQPPPSHHPA